MNGSTIDATTFIVSQGENNVSGTVDYSNGTATFTPSSRLSLSTTYTATITTGVKDLASNAMGGNYTWSFTTRGPLTYTIDSTGYVGSIISIAIDSSDKVHIGYRDQTNADLKYATNTSDSWVVSTIESNGDIGLNPSIDIDSNNKVHISYFDLTNIDLKYTTNASDSWVTSTIDSTGDVGGETSIAVDFNNKVHISYYDLTNGGLLNILLLSK